MATKRRTRTCGWLAGLLAIAGCAGFVGAAWALCRGASGEAVAAVTLCVVPLARLALAAAGVQENRDS